MVSPVPVLFVDHAPAWGGAENILKLLLEHLDPSRWELHLACVNGPLAEKTRHINVKIHTLKFPKLRHSLFSVVDWCLGSYRLARIARQIKARAIISNTIRATGYAGSAAKITPTPFVWIMHDFWLGESQPKSLWFDNLGKRVLCQIANTVIANSHATAGHLPCRFKTTVIHNGIDIHYFKPPTNCKAIRANFNLPDDAQVLGMIGRLRPWKGQSRFLRVLKHVMNEHPLARGMIVGGTPFKSSDNYAAQLHQYVRELDLQDRVIFTGQLEDIRPALAAMDIFVHPGDPEPFGLVNIEAMAMAKPVTAFAHGALPEIVKHGETGLLIPPVDERAMAEAISTLLHNPSQREAMGVSGRSRVEQAFSIAHTAHTYDEVLKTIVFKDN